MSEESKSGFTRPRTIMFLKIGWKDKTLERRSFVPEGISRELKETRFIDSNYCSVRSISHQPNLHKECLIHSNQKKIPHASSFKIRSRTPQSV